VTISDSETLTIGAAASGLTAGKIQTNVVQVTINSEGPVRYWTSGKTPTAAQGILLYEGTNLKLSRTEALAFKVIRTGGVDIVIQVQYITLL